MTQAALAEAAGISRQSLSAIEAGRTDPAVQLALRLSTALGSNVETLFGSGEPTGDIEAEVVSDAAPSVPERDMRGRRSRADADGARAGRPMRRTGASRVALAFVRDRWLAYPLSERTHTLTHSAHGLLREGARPHAGPAQVELLRPLVVARETVVLSGCAPALGVLAHALNAERGPGRFLWLEQSSASSMRALKHGRVHLAGVHLGDAHGDGNSAAVRRGVPRTELTLVTLAHWQAGLVVAPGNPLKIRGVADVARARLRLVTREPGAGARVLLQRCLDAAGVAPGPLLERASIAHGQLDVGRAIALGAADVGFAMEAAALAFGLDFIPLAEERFDLVIPRIGMDDAPMRRLFDMLNGGTFRRELANLGGYNAAGCGATAAEIRRTG